MHRKLQFAVHLVRGDPAFDAHVNSGAHSPARYNYNDIDLLHGGRWGYHLHPLPSRPRIAVPHLVCVRPDGTGEGDHFAAYEIDLLAAHDRFEEHEAFDRRIACHGLTRIS